MMNQELWRELELLEQYSPWRESELKNLGISLMLFLFGLVTTLIITYYTLTIVIFQSVQPLWMVLIGGAILLIMFNFLPGAILIIGACGFFGGLYDNILGSYRLWRYKI